MILRNILLLVTLLVASNFVITKATDTSPYQPSKVNRTELGIKFGYKAGFSVTKKAADINQQSYGTNHNPFILYIDNKTFLWNTSLGIEVTGNLHGKVIEIAHLHHLKTQIKKTHYYINSLSVAIPTSWWVSGYEKGISLFLAPNIVFIQDASMHEYYPNKRRSNAKDYVVSFNQFNIGAVLGLRYVIGDIFSVSSSVDYLPTKINESFFHLIGLNFYVGIDFLSLYNAIFNIWRKNNDHT